MKGLLVSGLLLVGANSFGQNIVNSSTLAPGDSTNVNGLTGSANWFYNDVQTGAVVGINSAIPRNGNGSMLYTLNGATSAKGDIIHFTGSSFGSLSTLTSWSYESFRSSVGSDPANQFHPSARVVVTLPGVFSFNQLVFDSLSVTSDSWVSNDITGTNGLLWSSRSFTIGSNSFGGNTGSNVGSQSNPQPLSFWQGLIGNASITGFNIGVGSGISGTYRGAADSLAFGFNGNTPVVNNFEVVPEPATMAALGLGAAALLRKRKK